ncbi:hypothetical protein CYMTET_32656 [Cymbomonas tetramitiformis]|uniref:Reverse transcriptase domain-containing protein n=1 Tax=Cymbomonas tetramitiformis TaxID=36881 RepID=A0AAE0FEK9_9CHLO|nr:hypothetical protein CYMTET_32656 [Cymbomonas tetramitiformis]
MRSEEAMKSVCSDLRVVTRILAMGRSWTRSATRWHQLYRCVRFFEAADLQSAVEVLNFGLAPGGFTPAVWDGRGKVTEKAILKPPSRERLAFVAALVEAAEQCVEALVARLGFKLPEVPQQSTSEYRTSDKRAREDNDENEEEEQAEDALFEEVEEVATGPKPVSQKGKGGAGISPEDLARDEELKRRMDAFLMQKVPGYAPATGKGEASVFAQRKMPCAKLRKQIVADPVPGEMKSVAVPQLPKDQFRAQNMKMVECFEDETERKHFLNYISWFVSLDNRYAWADLHEFDTQVRDDFIAGRLKSWDPIQLGFRFQYSFLETLGEASRRLLDDKGSRGGKGETARTGKARKPERTWSAKFLAMFTAVGVSLASYGVPEAEHQHYMRDVEAVGAVVSPLTERADRWAQAAWGLPGAEAVVRGVATGFAWQQAEPTEFFRVENYVPPQHEEKVALKLQEEADAGRMQRGFPGVVVYLDDFILIADTEEACQQGFEILIELVEYLGFEVAPEKVESPRQDIVFLGVRLQSNQAGLGVVAMSIDESRVQRVASACREMAVLPTVRVKEVERLVGQLMFCARVVYGAQMYLRSGYAFIGRAGRMRRYYDKVPGDLSRDLV